MATNTHIPVRSARRCILRPAVTKFLFATAVAIATCSALALSGALTAGPEIAQATGPRSAQAVSGQGYGYPVKPFDREHLDPRELRRPAHAVSRAADEGHAHARERQLLVPPGRRHLRFRRHRRLPGRRRNRHVRLVGVDPRDVGGGRAFEYWHIRPLVRKGQQVTARHTLLGRVTMISNHVHLTEYEGGRVVNPLVPGRLTPYHDSTPPVVRAITFRRTDGGADVLPIFVRGRVEIVADAEDAPTAAGFRKWYGPVTPALITWRIHSLRTGRDVVRERVARDVRNGVPRNSAFWQAYARGTYQNQMVWGNHYSYLERGTYLFKLAQQFDTRTLRDGVYDLIVKATDVRGNTGSQTLRFTVHNRQGWA